MPLNTARWQRLRALVLAEHPLCAHCFALGRVALATDVDHADGNPGNNARGNLQSLCHACHSRKTGRERAGLPADHGCDVNGWPLDPGHPWNEKSPATERVQTDRAPSIHR
ncbi:MAG: hypothetical protein BGO72_01525 [Burkholderiales bacterium 70-64]|nr:MAG: hypothetical protein BGO72_01525 [Burkholderiales bacterium 70-64]